MSSVQIFGWSDATLAQFYIWSSLCYPVFFFPSAWVLSRSLRAGVLIQAATTFMGSTLRCLHISEHLNLVN